MNQQAQRIYEFGPFRLDAAEHLVLRDGEAISLTPKAFDLLLALVERHGHLLEKDELLKKVWPDTFVEEANLASNISQLRKALVELQEISKRHYVSPVDVAAIHAGLGEKDQAFAWLEKGFQRRAVGITSLKIDLRFGSIRSDPRFADLLRRIGLTP